jgi:outer membrane protein assembly factor BamD
MTRVMQARRLAAILTTTAIAVGCATRGPYVPAITPNPDKFLLERGKDNLDRKRWINAREYFRSLVDTYPQSPYRSDAKLAIGDTYMGERTSEGYVLAINEFREFLNFFPTSARAYYAQFQLGMAHFNQMKAPLRDQTETRNALREFETYVAKFADQPLIGEARRRLREASDRLDESDVSVAEHYFRIRWYPASIGRLTALLAKDPEFTRRDKAYYLLAASLERMHRSAEALPYYERLIKEFEQSDYLEPSRKRLADLEATRSAPPVKDTAKSSSR